MRPFLAIVSGLFILSSVPDASTSPGDPLQVVAEDDCGVDGRQRHLVSGMNWAFTTEEIPVSAVPKDSYLRSISYGATVQYRYRGLKSGARYRLRVSYLSDNRIREQLCLIDGQAMGDTIRLIPSQPLIASYDILRGAYADGQIDVEFRLLKGPNAVVSFLELLSDDPTLQPVLETALTSDFKGLATGYVEDANTGEPIGSAEVTASVDSLHALRTVTGADGSFSLRIPEVWNQDRYDACRFQVRLGDATAEKRLSLFELYPEKNPLAVVPDSVPGIGKTRISLNGQWHCAVAPVGEFWKAEAPADMWAPINVPGECRMQGFAVDHDREFAYQRRITIPADYEGSRVFIRFHGVYSAARVWVNGTYVRSHHGGFTSWDCEITDLVKPGEDAVLTLGVTDRIDEISFGSGYAKHPIGGILRGVDLLAVPKTYIRQLYVDTALDSLCRDALLRVDAALSDIVEGEIRLRLTDPAGNPVSISPSSMLCSTNSRFTSTTIQISSPFLWDAEHPRLYTLEASFESKGHVREVIRRRIGFRKIEVAGRQLLVNGRPVKLRGACRHDIHPTQGRSTTPEQDRLDVLLAKEANFNFIRTSHYPPSQEFLDWCDELGIYVEEETAVCFVGTFREGIYRESGSTQSDQRYTDRYLSQLIEMIDRDRNHPSVIIWSIGNENAYGTNFQKEYAYVKSVDRSRPVMFSFPHMVPRGVTCFDIWSNHYPSFDRCLNLPESEKSIAVPVLGDEWMHVACYCKQDLMTDPNIRNFWGESLKRAWENNFDSDFSIGGAIWGMVDEVFFLPDSSTGYGQWGIVDVWRRKKPEFWHTRKGYSPVRVTDTRIARDLSGQELAIPIHNRFDHTNLREVRIACSSGTVSEEFFGPDIPPHGRGVLPLPRTLANGLPIQMHFFDANGQLIDEETLTYAPEGTRRQGRGGPLEVALQGDSIVARGKTFSLVFDRKTGLVRSGTYDGVRVLEGGPYIRLVVPGRRLSWDVDSLVDAVRGSWRCDTIATRSTDTSLTLSLGGMAGPFRARIGIEIHGSGEILTTYEVDDPPQECQEAGVRYLLSASLDRISWSRRALWSVYPDDHIGRPEGEADITGTGSGGEVYGHRPEQPWAQDTKDFYLYRTGDGLPPGGMPVPNDARGTKENIETYAVFNRRTGLGVRVEAGGNVAARTNVHPDGRMDLLVNTHWTYMNLNWGNYERPATLEREHRGGVKMRLWRGE